MANIHAAYDAVDAVRLAFVGAALSVLLVYAIPALRSRLLDYGARSDQTVSSSESKAPSIRKEDNGQLNKALDHFATYKVPHSWFESFYQLSLTLSLCWMLVLPITRSSIPWAAFVDLDRSSTPISRTQLACILMLCQGIRRYVECRIFKTASNSKMWIGHWFVGLGFYLGMSVAIWIEGLPGLLEHEFGVRDIELKAPSIRTAVSLLLFVLASGIQHDCHAYLASLRRSKTKDKSGYQMPTFPAFSLTLTPHYFMECLIYLALAILAAPEGHYLNNTICCALFFVLTNLGVTAIGTRKWYERKFDEEAVRGKYAMIPFIL